LGGNDGGTDILLRVRDRSETSQALVFGGPLLAPGDDCAPGILASVLHAYIKLPVFLVSTGVLVEILVAHGSSWSTEGRGRSNSVSGREIARLRRSLYKCGVDLSIDYSLSLESNEQVGNGFAEEPGFIPLFIPVPTTRAGIASRIQRQYNDIPRIIFPLF
jgi:hypothetical protein